MKKNSQDSKPAGEFWLRLDNAAKIYPAVQDRQLTSVFRVEVALKERVKAKQFLEAVHFVENRFPYYKVKLNAGFFWYYLEPRDWPIAVEVDEELPCRAFEKNELMFRVLVREKKISVEFSHILTDATGAFEFLKTLVFTYFEKCGIPAPAGVPFFHPGETPAAEEFEDAYSRYFKRQKAALVKLPRAFHLPFPVQKPLGFHVLTAVIPLDVILKKAKEHEVSLTEYLTAVYLYALQGIYEQLPPFRKRSSNKIIRIEVPVNLRKIYPTQSMRNFSLYVIPGIDLRLGHYTFEEVVKTVYHLMQLETDKKLIGKMLSRNVSGEKNPFLRGIPLFFKSLVLSRLYALGTRQYSGVVTNLGKISFGPETDGLINRFAFIPPPPNKTLKVNCGAVGFGNQLVLTFGNITGSTELERRFFSFLTRQGIPVKLIKN
ncbi:hypothetical protein V9K67_09385 [Paraflavisolibacter sp. H34]|uniref:hypothetical protein n=1 Tax=Huijunlia imazamoxiresistens TaxID=3127457 RepID=UPI003015CD52